jgi:hypothetical protein
MFQGKQNVSIVCEFTENAVYLAVYTVPESFKRKCGEDRKACTQAGT